MTAETPKISKTAKKSAQSPWFETLRPLAEQNSLKADEKARLHAIYTRFTLYDEGLWKNHRRLYNQTQKLIKAIHAYNELSAADPQPADITHMQNVIIDIMRIKMTRIELDQLKVLSNTQRINRRYIPVVGNAAALTIQAKKAELESEIQQAESDFSKTKSIYLKQAKAADLSQTSRFFKRREFYWRHNAYLSTSNKTSALFNFFAHLNNLWLTFVHGVPGLLPFLHFAGSFLQAIPIVNAVLEGIPLIISAIKVMLKDKSTAKRALMLFLIVLFAASFITAGLSALAGTLVTIGLLLTGALVKRLIPMVQTHKEIYRYQKELLELKQPEESLRNMMHLLKDREQQHILIELENNLIQHKISRGSYDHWKALTQSRHFDILNADIEFRNLIGSDLESFLFNKLEERRRDVEAEIIKLSKMNREHLSGLFNNFVSLVGIILLPFFPPAGLILIGISSAIGVSRQFSLTTKALSAIWNGLKGLHNFLMRGEPTKSSRKPSSTAQTTETLDIKPEAEVIAPKASTAAKPTPKLETAISHSSSFIKPKEKEEEQEGEGNHKGAPDDTIHPPQV